jgi:ABC-type multidrug transport system fused ATPase/permease subunit
MSIYENIRFGKLNATRVEIEEAARQANAHTFIMQLPDVRVYNTYLYLNIDITMCCLEI